MNKIRGSVSNSNPIDTNFLTPAEKKYGVNWYQSPQQISIDSTVEHFLLFLGLCITQISISDIEA